VNQNSPGPNRVETRNVMNGRDQDTPSVPRILATAVWASVVVSATLWVFWGITTWRETAGTALGLLASATLLRRASSMVVARGEARLSRVLARAADTGTWLSRWDPAVSLSVRWDYLECAFYLSGWISDNWQIEGELRWSGEEALCRLIREVEMDGLKPTDTSGTRAVKDRLGLL